jgi:hypothetical protein
MIIDKSPRASLIFATLAVSIVALTASPGVSIAKPASKPVAQTHRLNRVPAPRAPAAQPNDSVYDPFAWLLLG